ncbi:hypothetical protein GCM10010527_13630 [Streptomyces drozdowiczii]
MHVAERLVEGLFAGGAQDDRRGCLLVLRRQHEAGTGHCYCCRHAAPRSSGRRVPPAVIAPAGCFRSDAPA